LTVRQLLREYDPACADDRRLAEVLRDRLIGSIEHTRNGHNRLEDVYTRHGALSRPAFSIAVSRLKREDEAQEVAASVLNAIENTLHATGLVLSRRHCVVIGCCGAIGARLQQALQRRVRHSRQVAGIDLAGERLTYRQIPLADRRRVDLVVGAAGCSVLQPEDVEEWMLDGESQELILASASTKKEEFSGVAAWLDTLLRDGAPQVGGRPLRISIDPLTDPVSGRIFGRRCRAVVVHPSGERQRDILLVADLTPVNFMFYGVATEMIDEVLALLLRCGLGMVRQSAIGSIVPALMAVDVDISADGEPLRSGPGTQRTVATQISGLTDPSITAT
jgi:hypothetical protein